jgi:hypothetical protein
VCAVILFICGIIYFVEKIMDAEDLFRKLTTGAKFNLKKYSADAQKLKVCIVFGSAPLHLCNIGIILYCWHFYLLHRF